MTLFYKTGSGFPFDLGSTVFKKVNGRKVYGKVHRVDFCKDGVRYRFKPFKNKMLTNKNRRRNEKNSMVH